MGNLSRYLLVAVVAFLVAAAATWLSRSVMEERSHEGGELHVLVHKKLDLDAGQMAEVEKLEKQFAGQRKRLDAEMQAANAELANAIASEHKYGPKVAEAVDHSHRAMGELQKATLSHVFAMRALLRPDQAKHFDEEVAKTLTRHTQE